MKKLPLGIQNFKEIITGDYVYVDKTQHIYNLVNDAKYYFLSRPRRFGKSLLLDTIGEVFGGDKELFKGLWIYDSDYDFPKHPVIRLDMSNISNENHTMLKNAILDDLRIKIEDEELDITSTEPSSVLKRLIRGLHKKYGKGVIVLIDEYDKPILDHITDIETASKNRQVLRDFYGILKSMDPFLRLTFITGVTKFTKTSIFSGLNNLTDITLSEDYANICGITIEDLEGYFGEHIKNLSSHKRFQQYDSIHDEILAWYDGYSWDGETKLLNPFSLLSFLNQKRFAGFWYSSGTPGFLLDLIRKNPETYTNLRSFEITESMLDSVEIEKITIEPLLFQTGYLTIKEIPLVMDELVYILDIPNKEVRRALNLHILSALTENNEVQTGQLRLEINRALGAGDLPKILDVMRGFFASIPYQIHVELEAYYHSVFYSFMSALGFDLDLEVSVAKGRVDAILEHSDKVYVMEFKYVRYSQDASDEEKQKLSSAALDDAMKQINDKGYGEKYQGSGKTVYQAAFAFLGRGDIEMRAESR